VNALLPDPPVREDGRCIVCPKARHPERSRKYAGGTAETDPFCSTQCARAYYGTSLPATGHEVHA
jgi:hypothetical protein